MPAQQKWGGLGGQSPPSKGIRYKGKGNRDFCLGGKENCIVCPRGDGRAAFPCGNRKTTTFAQDGNDFCSGRLGKKIQVFLGEGERGGIPDMALTCQMTPEGSADQNRSIEKLATLT